MIVVPVSTSKAQTRRGPTVVELPAAGGLLKKPSVAVCHQATTLDRAKLSPRVGLLPPDLLRAVEEGLKAALDLE